MTDEQILRRAMTAAMTLDADGMERLIAATRSVRWAMMNLEKPMAADYNDVYFRRVVEKYYESTLNLMGLQDAPTP